ncbi:MAG: NAD(P)/FAD-dependent oxidoreductase [Spirochaetes bacterium]|nr:NAD(P)/FAD-dependent oxidoreductase [Spirochaetota bacterium]
MKKYELIVIGGGPAGLAAAIEAKKNGISSILVLERDRELGGILQQCIHNGFGLHIFKEELTGPEYAERFINELQDLGIEYWLDTMVIDLTADKTIKAINRKMGMVKLEAKAVILAMGCRERACGALAIPGTRPAGIFSAGTAQRFINMEGYMVGKNVVILGSGDIGLIMARRMTLEGAKVHAVAEIMPFSSGLTRNIVQCLNDFDIPLLLSHTVTKIFGQERLEGVIVSEVDENRQPIPGTEIHYDCDTLLLSVGLIPENELSSKAGIKIDKLTSGPIVNEAMETTVPGIFACGNVVHVHDLVDFVTRESQKAGYFAANYIKNEKQKEIETPVIRTKGRHGINYVISQVLREKNLQSDVELFMRVKNVYRDINLVVKADGKPLKSFKKRYVAPGEMQHLTIDSALIRGNNFHELSVEVE